MCLYISKVLLNNYLTYYTLFQHCVIMHIITLLKFDVSCYIQYTFIKGDSQLLVCAYVNLGGLLSVYLIW